LQDQVYRLVRGKDLACAEDLGEELTPEQLEGDPECPLLGLAHGADARDIWVLDPGSAVKLISQVDKPGGLSSGLAAPGLRAEDHELDLDVRVGVFGEIDIPEGALAQPLEHPEPVRQGAAREWKFGAGTRTWVV
jgi:hypothetical protein